MILDLIIVPISLGWKRRWTNPPFFMPSLSWWHPIVLFTCRRRCKDSAGRLTDWSYFCNDILAWTRDTTLLFSIWRRHASRACV